MPAQPRPPSEAMRALIRGPDKLQIKVEMPDVASRPATARSHEGALTLQEIQPTMRYMLRYRQISRNHVMIARSLLCMILLLCSTALAATPSSLRLDSGKSVAVIGISRSTLKMSDESVLVLKYQTDIEFTDMQSLSAEVESVWAVFQKTADKAKVQAAIVVASAKKAGFGVTASAGWVWKKGTDGTWHEPMKGDRALVPKEQ